MAAMSTGVRTKPARWRGVVVPLLVLLACETGLRVRPMQSDAVAAPSAVLMALATALADGTLVVATAQTAWATLGGLLLGAGTGLLAGLALGLSRRAATSASLLIELLRPLPSVALIPVALLVFGFGYRLEVAVVGFAVFFPMLLLAMAAVRAVPARLMEVSAVLRLSMAARVGKIVLPAAMPRLFVALRLCVGIALVVAVTTEIASNPQGLGYALLSAQQSLAPDTMLAVLLWIALIGWCANAGLQALERCWFGAMRVGGSLS